MDLKSTFTDFFLLFIILEMAVTRMQWLSCTGVNLKVQQVSKPLHMKRAKIDKVIEVLLTKEVACYIPRGPMSKRKEGREALQRATCQVRRLRGSPGIGESLVYRQIGITSVPCLCRITQLLPYFSFAVKNSLII